MRTRAWLSGGALLAGACIFASVGLAGHAQKTGGTLRVAGPGDLDHIDPALAYLIFSWTLEFATCARLYNYPDRSRRADLKDVRRQRLHSGDRLGLPVGHHIGTGDLVEVPVARPSCTSDDALLLPDPGAARRNRWAKLDMAMMHDDPPFAPFANLTEVDFISKSLGCYVLQPAIGRIDLAAACKK